MREKQIRVIDLNPGLGSLLIFDTLKCVDPLKVLDGEGFDSFPHPCNTIIALYPQFVKGCGRNRKWLNNKQKRGRNVEKNS